jgi:PleD family two-component response regulator
MRLIGAIDAYIEEFSLIPRPKTHTVERVEELSTSEAMSEQIKSGVEVRELEAEQEPTKKLRIMAIDNSSQHLDEYAQMLNKYSDFIPCDDAISAMEKIVRYNPDIIIMNPKLEKISGLQLCRFIKGLSQTPVFEIIFCADDHDMQTAAEATKISGNPMLAFPLNQDQFLGTVKNILHKPTFRLKKKKSDLESLKMEESAAEQKKKETTRKLKEISSLHRKYQNLQSFIDEYMKS